MLFRHGISVVGGRTAFSAKGGAFGNGGYAGIGITSSDGQLWKYEDGTVVTGRVVAFTDYDYDIAESEDFNDTSDLFVRYTPSDDSIYGLSEAKKSEWLTTRTPESYIAAGAKLCTVVRKSGSDLNRYLTEGDGELNFNALVVGVPENAAYLTENMHLRAFIVCGGVTYYSAVKTDSVYGAVKRVSADPNYENDPYIRRIIELCETTNG